MQRRRLLGSSGALMMSTLLPGCGGGSTYQTRLRLLNLSRGYAALDLYVDGDLRSAGVAYGQAGDYLSVDDAALTTALTRNGSTSYLLSASRTLTSDSDNALLAYGWDGGLKLMQLSDEEDAADSGEVSLRVLNVATDAGKLDLYVTGESDGLASSTPTISGVAGGSGSSYTTLQAGTYRLRVTANGDSSDLRMDVSDVVLSSQAVLSLALVNGAGGVLVSGLMLTQGGSTTALTSAAARVRVVAAVDGNASVYAALWGSALMSGSGAPSLGSYVRVASGSQPLSVTVNGVSVSVDALDAVDGNDYTLLVHGSETAPQLTVVTDDNRLPVSTANYKIRLVHAASSLSGSGLGMTVNYAAVATDVAYAAASEYHADAALSAAALEVSSPLATSSVYALSDLSLTATGVYSVYVMMNGSTPVGVLRKER